MFLIGQVPFIKGDFTFLLMDETASLYFSTVIYLKFKLLDFTPYLLYSLYM